MFLIIPKGRFSDCILHNILSIFVKHFVGMKLFYVILGATPKGRNIEQHDVFFGIAENFDDLIPEMKNFWKDAKIHVDCYQEVRFADGFEVKVIEKNSEKLSEQLFFINPLSIEFNSPYRFWALLSFSSIKIKGAFGSETICFKSRLKAPALAPVISEFFTCFVFAIKLFKS